MSFKTVFAHRWQNPQFRRKHRDTKAQRHKENRRLQLLMPVFFVPLCLCVSVFSNALTAEGNFTGGGHGSVLDVTLADRLPSCNRTRTSESIFTEFTDRTTSPCGVKQIA